MPISIRSLGSLLAVTSIAMSIAAPVAAADLPVAHGIDGSSPPLPFFVRLGVSAVLPDADVAAKIAGVPVAGGNASVSDEPAAYVEAGYYLTRNIVASLTAGYPPTFATRGTGSLAPFGTLYRSEVGLPVFEVTYHLDAIGRFRPYAGVGVGYAFVFRNEAAAILSPRLRDGAAFVLVGGVDYDLTERWGVFVDVKKAFLTQRFAGVGPPFPGGPAVLPVEARVRTDPLIVTTGFSYRF